MLATHGRPSTMTTLSAPSCAMTHVPTIGVKVVGGAADGLLAQIHLDVRRANTVATIASAATRLSALAS